jgi:hypothetical protein
MLRAILRRFPSKAIGDGAGNNLLIRHVLFKSGPLSVYLHEFNRGDNDRCLHDHPWHFLVVILAGGYSETMADGKTYWRRPGSILWRPARTAHRVDLPAGRRAWSLVIVGRKRRDWGFFTPSGWRKWAPNYKPICE